MTGIIDITLLAFLVIVALAIVRIRNLFAVTMLTGLFSLLVAAFFLLLDAADVALTEAAVGAGILIILKLATLVLTTSREKVHHSGHNLLALAVCAVTGAALIYGTLDMPHFGEPDAPAHLHVAPHYIQQSYDEIGIPNVVTSVLASYRGFDTLGEAVVIFVAGVGVLLLLGTGAVAAPTAAQALRDRLMTEDELLRVITKLMIPIILLFALYVQFHGEYGPGGGFQAGIIFAAAFVIYSFIYGLQALQSAIPPRVVHALSAFGVLLYGGFGIASMLLGGNFLEYKVLLADKHAAETLGIIGIELGVGIVVAAVSLSLFYAFAGRGRQTES